MRFIIIHKTNAGWEAGAIPGKDLIARVGALMAELGKSGVLRDGAGLRASSQGVRLRFARGERTAVEGPFTGENELPAAFSVVRTSTREEAIDWASRVAAVLGDVEIDVRPVTETWDIGIAPQPADVTTRRWMALVKATAASESRGLLTFAQRTELARLQRESVHLVTEVMKPSARGRRYRTSREGLRTIDGPFTESKELIAGYIIVSLPSLEEASHLARRYLEVVGATEVDVRELEEPRGVPLLNEDGTASMATMLMSSHHAFRRDLQCFAAALARIADRDVAALREEWKSFRTSLHHHHQIEDTSMFPGLKQGHSGLAPALARLEDDHRRIDPLLTRGDAAFAALPAPGAAAVIAELQDLLDEHLALEEAEVVPLLRGAREFPPPPDEAALQMYAQGFAWSSHGIAPEVLERVYALLPEELRARLPAARAAFEERCVRVWGSAGAGASRTSVPDLV